MGKDQTPPLSSTILVREFSLKNVPQRTFFEERSLKTFFFQIIWETLKDHSTPLTSTIFLGCTVDTVLFNSILKIIWVMGKDQTPPLFKILDTYFRKLKINLKLKK